MRYILTLIVGLVIVIACGRQDEIPRTNPPSDEITTLKDIVLNLQGTVDQINNFVASDFSSCDSGSLPPFETKICQIAQTATADSQITLFGQLQTLQSIMQESLYGNGCINDTDAGCPVADSIVDQLNNIDVSGIQSDISQLQADVLSIQSSINAITNRLDDFDGSGQSIETVINGIESELISLDSRLDNIEAVVSGTDYYEWLFIGDDISGLNAHEPLLRTGDKLKIIGYVVSNTNNGMGIIAEANSSGDQYLSTAVKPSTSFKIYDRTTELLICWDNTDRSAAESTIDTECDSANSFANPTANCTCK